MKRLSMGAFLLSAAFKVWAADCIQVEDQDFDLSTNDIGSAVVNWKAEFRNECRSTLDADITVHLLDEESESVYELLDKATLGVSESLEIEKEVYVPSRIVDEVEGFSIQIVERERQF